MGFFDFKFWFDISYLYLTVTYKFELDCLTSIDNGKL